MIGGYWGKRSASRWLVASLCTALVFAAVSVVSMVLGFSGSKAQGVGTCTESQHRVHEMREAHGLGRWDDGPQDLHLNWFVCKSRSVSNTSMWHGFNSSWYLPRCGWYNYEGAAQRCSQYNASLVSIVSKEENNFVQQLCGREACWIGLHQKPGYEIWVWPDGTTVGSYGDWHAFTNWNRGKPDNYEGRDETVAYMNNWYRLGMPDPADDAGDCSRGPRIAPVGSGKWFDISKDFRILYSICEKAAVAGGCSFGSGKWEFFQGSCYQKLCAMYDFWEAEAACVELGAQLVSINSSKENEIVRHLCGPNTCRIGLSEPFLSELWTWADGRNIGKKFEWNDYVNWNDGEPNNWQGRDEDCAVMNSDDIGKSVQKAMKLERILAAAPVWNIVQIVVPIVLLIGACLASRCNMSCCAQAVCIAAGLASILLIVEVIAWLVLAFRVDKHIYPGGSRTLFVCEAIVAVLQVICCCVATAKAQELQWATTVGVVTREVDGQDFGGPMLTTELRNVDRHTGAVQA